MPPAIRTALAGSALALATLGLATAAPAATPKAGGVLDAMQGEELP